MRKMVLIAAALAACSFAMPAAAQSVTGTVVINGNVPGKCQVVSGAGVSQTFGTTVDLGDLSDTDGTLKSGLVVNSANFADLEARVVCTTAFADVTLTATPLAIANAPASEPGYANSISYTAYADLTTTTGSSTLSLSTNVGSPTGTTIGRLANNGGNNIVIYADTFETAPDAILEQGAYSGQITLLIAPAA